MGLLVLVKNGDAMSFAEWSERYGVHIQEIDRQHIAVSDKKYEKLFRERGIIS